MHTKSETAHSVPGGETNTEPLTDAFDELREETAVLPKKSDENRTATTQIRANPRPWSALNE